MKYAVLTDFNLVTEDIKNGIIDLASNLEHLKKNVFILKNSFIIILMKILQKFIPTYLSQLMKI